MAKSLTCIIYFLALVSGYFPNIPLPIYTLTAPHTDLAVFSLPWKQKPYSQDVYKGAK